MSIFNPDIIKESNDWANNELYACSAQICPVTLRPAWIVRRTDDQAYHTIHSLYREYRDIYERYDCNRVHINYFTREEFINIVKDKCQDIIRFKNVTYYSWRWFYEKFAYLRQDINYWY